MALLPRPVSPLSAIRDLRAFLAQREPHQLIFAFLSFFVTAMLILGFYVDSRVEKVWKRDIQYVESWPLSRSDAEIVAQQRIDLAKRREREKVLEARKQERMRQFQKVDRQLESLGF